MIHIDFSCARQYQTSASECADSADSQRIPVVLWGYSSGALWNERGAGVMQK